MEPTMNIGVIGYGYWGPNLVRNFSEIQNSSVTIVCDTRPERLALIRNRYPGMATTTDPRDIYNRSDVDAVVIATPVSTHYDLAMQALNAGKHVLVEKPLTSSYEQAVKLVETADRLKKVFMVDHTFVYTGAVRKIRELIDNSLGELYYYDSVRVNLGLFQHDVNVLWDLAVHDLAILEHIVSARPLAVSATGVSHVAGEPENIAYLSIWYENNIFAHIHVNWLAPVKVRRTLIGGSQKMVVYDDLEPDQKIKVYDKGITLNQSPESVYQMMIGYRTGDMWAPKIDGAEALKTEAVHFLDCIQNGKTPLTDGRAGMRVVKILEAANQSMAERGRMIELKPEKADL